MQITTLFGITSDRKNLHTKKRSRNETYSRRISPSFHKREDSSTDGTHHKRSSTVIHDSVRTTKNSRTQFSHYTSKNNLCEEILEIRGARKHKITKALLHIPPSWIVHVFTWLWRNNCNNIISQYPIGQYFSPVTASYRKQEVNNAWWVVLLQPMKIHNNRAPNSCINMAALSKWISLKSFLFIFKVISQICCLLRKREHPQLS